MNKVTYSGYRFPPEIIQQGIWLYLRFTLRPRDVEDLLAEHGVAVSTKRVGVVSHFGPMIEADLRKRRPKPHMTWHLDEVYLKIDGRMVFSGGPSTPRARSSMCWSSPGETSMAFGTVSLRFVPIQAPGSFRRDTRLSCPFGRSARNRVGHRP
jgi:hypothetical protein